MNTQHLEAERQRAQYALDAQKSALDRNKMGQFPTPYPLAKELLEYAKGVLPAQPKIRFLDPALGTGVFYSALLEVFGKAAIAKATGFEIDPHYGLPSESIWQQHGLNLRHEDFTRAEPISDFNLVICNPPYVRHHHISGEDKEHLNARTASVTGITMSGLAGLYGHFLLQTDPWLAPGAVAAWLIPSEFMDVNYGRAIKQYLLSQVTLLHIHRFDPEDVQFDDALVSSAIVWIRNEKPASGHQVLFTFGGSLAQPAHGMEVPLDALSVEPKWTRFPMQGIREQRDAQTTVGDLFRIKRGIATGDNAFFILNEEMVRQRNLPAIALRPVLPTSRYMPESTVETDEHGLPTNAQRLFLLDPRMDQDQIDRDYPSLAAYLREGEAKGLPQKYLCRSRKRWYDQEQRVAAPIICTYMGRKGGSGRSVFRFIRNRSNATVTNSYLALYPTPNLVRLIAADPGLIDRVWEQLTEIPEIDLLNEGRVYGGGLHKLEPKELAKVPIDIR